MMTRNQAKRSIRSRMVELLLRVRSGKTQLTDQAKLEEFMQERKVKNEQPYQLPARLKFTSSVIKEMVNGMEVVKLSPKEGASKKQILYFHGGAYVNQPVYWHWRFLDKVATETKATILVPLYPKAPGHHYEEAFQNVLPIYERLLTTTNPLDIVIMGDSAGGGLSLALAQLLLERKLPQPGHIILLSPWLDITMKHPEIPALSHKDPMLGAYGLIVMGKAWAGDADPEHYLLSPINGKIKGLGQITLFVGTHELFLPDARKFRDLAKAQGVQINYFEYKGMNHVFPVYPIPEAKQATEQIIGLIKGEDV